MSWFYISGNQRHGGVLGAGGPNPERERTEGESFEQRKQTLAMGLKDSAEIHYNIYLIRISISIQSKKKVNNHFDYMIDHLKEFM